MSKNITIEEGGIGRNFTAKKLQTALTGGGSQYWVPEDEAAEYCNFEEKEITENGEYNASDDSCDGYSKVTVNVESNLGTKDITANGTYKASKDGYDGYSKVKVNVKGGTEINELNVTENGTYEAEEGAAYNPVNVNIEANPGDTGTSEDGRQYSVSWISIISTTGVLQLSPQITISNYNS